MTLNECYILVKERWDEIFERKSKGIWVYKFGRKRSENRNRLLTHTNYWDYKL